MTLKALDFSFAPMSDLSHRPPYAVPEGEWLGEIEEELRQRAGAYPRFVREQRMKAEEADRHVAILRAIGEDLRERAFYDADDWQPGSRFVRAGADFHFDDKVRELRREIALRRNAWPRALAAHRMDAGTAAARMERLEAVHWLYWVDLFRADDVFAAIADKAARTVAIRAWAWRRDEWLRAEADAGNPAVPSGASAAARAAWRATFSERDRAYAADLDALYRAAAEAHGFAQPERSAA